MDFLGAAQRLLRWAAVAVLIAVPAFILVEAVNLERHAPRQRLTQVYTPSYRHLSPPPPTGETLRALQRDLMSPRGALLLRSTVPSEAGMLWLALIVALAIGFDFEHLRNPRNVDLLAMQALGVCMFGILGFLRALDSPELARLMDWVFNSIFALNIFLIVRAFWEANRPVRFPWKPVLPTRALAAIAMALVLGDLTVAMVHEPDDVGFFVNLGAQRLRERGKLPYGDPLLTGSAGAAYGPLLYVAHLPFQLMLAPTPVNADSPDRPVLGDRSTYFLPPQLATKLCTVAFHLVGILALLLGVRRLAGWRRAWAIVALYAGSAYVLGIGGANYFIGGMTYISHIAPTAVTLCAFATLDLPVAAGVLLATGAGVSFYPAFMLPAWLGYYWDRPRLARKFLAGFLVTAAVVGIGVLLLSRAVEGRGLIATILSDTFGHHTDPLHYGSSPFSFWGQHGGIRGWMMRPLVADSGFTSPVFLSLLLVSAGCFWRARRKDARQLALLTAVVASAASLTKIHPTGTYVAWFYPFLLIGFFCASSGPSADAESDEAS